MANMLTKATYLEELAEVIACKVDGNGHSETKFDI